MIQLGDLQLVGDEPPPAKLVKALAVVGAYLHPLFDDLDWIAPNKSKESCVLASAAVRDFLHLIGFADAKLVAVATLLRAFEPGTDNQLHSLGIGVPRDNRQIHDRWKGHLIVTVGGWLIDATLYQALRPQWPKLTGMVAARLASPTDIRFQGLRAIAGFSFMDDSGVEFDAAWFANPVNRRWKSAPDLEPWRRAVVVAALRDRFGEWRSA